MDRQHTRHLGARGLAAAAAVLLAAPALARAEQADAAGTLEQARAAYAKRLDPARSAEALELYEKAADAGAGYAAMWEGARAASDRGESRMPGASRRQKREVYKRGVELARRAVKTNPEGAEGHLYLAITLGHHAQHQSLLHQMGAAGEIRREAERAVKLNPRAECGTPLRVLGLYYLRLPEAFGGDDEQAVRLLARGVEICPDDPDAHLDYAEALVATGRRDKALAELEWVLANPPRRAVDKVGYRETRASAQKMLEKLRR